MWQVFKEAGRPWPVLSEDDVTDYMVMEAVALKVGRDIEAADQRVQRKDAQRAEAQELLKKINS